jgi:hypothetical protein
MPSAKFLPEKLISIEGDDDFTIPLKIFQEFFKNFGSKFDGILVR